MTANTKAVSPGKVSASDSAKAALGRASVVIACYNDADIVERNLAALARQSFRDFEVIIADEGVGIPTEIFEKMFEPFFTTKELGTGLGLSMARDVMTRIGGRIRAENRVSHGAAFILNFPVAR